MNKFKVGDIIKCTDDTLWEKVELLSGNRIKILTMVRSSEKWKVGQIVSNYSPNDFETKSYWVLDDDSIVDGILKKYSSVSIDLLKLLDGYNTETRVGRGEGHPPEPIKGEDLGEFRM